ncbi:MAG TPA: hypothetical protein VIM82_00775 [Sulfurimonas sp.]
MSTFIDIAMMLLFILFMVFVFGGYHKSKSEQRETEEKKLKDKENTL